MANTRIPGTIIRSGSIPTTALGGGVVSSSAQVINHINNQKITPAQITASGHIVPSVTEIYDLGSPNLKFRDLYLSGSTIYLGTLALSDSGGTLAVSPSGSPAGTSSPVSGSFTGSFFGDIHATNGVISSSAQVIASLPTNTVSASAQVTAFLPTGTVSSSTQLPSGIASSSGQIKDYLPVDTVSSSAQVTAFLPANTVSSSGQISLSGISGTTFSNNDFNFPLNVTVNGLLTATSQSIVYITSSQLNVGSNDIILNTTEQLRYGGLTVFDSGSANQSGSLFWDSLHNVWLYVHAGTSNTSSIVITGPENTGVLGSEAFLTANRIPKAGLIGDHIVDSQISDNGTTVGMTGNLSVTGSLTIATNALFVSSSGNVGIGTTNPAYLLDVQKSDAGNVVDFRITNTESANAASGTRAIVQTNGASAGDPRLVLSVAGVREYSLGIDNSDSDKFKINDGSDPSSGTNYLTIDTSGNVGIGTTIPGEKLHVEGNLKYTGYIERGALGARLWVPGQAIGQVDYAGLYGPVLSYLAKYDGGWKSIGGGVGSAIAIDEGYFSFSNTNAVGASNAALTWSTRLAITPAGYVGIGITNPEARLDIVGQQQGTITTLGSEVPGLIIQQRLTSDANGNAGPMIDFRTSNGADVWTQGAIATIAAGTYAGQMAFYTQPGGTTDTTGRRTKGASLVERLRIKENGYVGIGTTDPQYPLEVKLSSEIQLRVVGSSTGYTQGAIVISGGTDNTPNDRGQGIFLFNEGQDVTWYMGTNYNAGSTFSINRQASTTSVAPSTAQLTYSYLTIDSAGNVGIGIASPLARLHVRNSSTSEGTIAIGHANYPGMIYSNASTGEFRIDNRSSSSGGYITFYPNGQENVAGNEAMRITAARNVGIGTTNPTSILSVRGSTDLGDSHESSLTATHQTRISGYALRYDASNRYGNYGNIILHASNGWTSSAKRFLISNGLGANKFAIIRSVDALTDPAFGDGGVISSGTADFVIDNAGKIGIGTTNPGGKLQVNVGDFIKSTTTGYDGTFDNVFKYMVTGDVGVNTNRWIGANATITAGGASANKLDFRVYQGNAAQDQAPLVVMTLQGDGSVGIGTDDALGYRLFVNGNALITGTQGFNATDETATLYLGDSASAIQAVYDRGMDFFQNGTRRLRISGSTGHVVPGANGTQNLGASDLRWSTVFTSDLSLSNGIGDWTIVEGEDDLFIYNNKNNKVYKFTLQEVDPSTATPKKS